MIVRLGCGAVRARRNSSSRRSHPLVASLDVLLGLQLTCDGVAVSGEFEVRVEALRLRFTFRPDRVLNPMKPGPCSAQLACNLATARQGQSMRQCLPHSASRGAAHQSPLLLLNSAVTGCQLLLKCRARKMGDSSPNVRRFSLPPSNPIALSVRYVDRQGEVGYSRQRDERLCVAALLRASFRSRCARNSSLRVFACVSMPVCCKESLVALARRSADYLTELRGQIAHDAQVAVADIVSVHCGLFELTDRYDVDELVNADILVVRLRTHLWVPESVGSSAAAPVSGHKRGADGSAAKGADGGESTSKRSKSSSNK